MKHMARPSEYDPSIAADICTLISTESTSIRAVCNSDERFPEAKTFYRWMLSHDELRQLYARAKDEQLQILADDIQAITDEAPEMCEIPTKSGSYLAVDRGWLEQRRQRVEARKWLLSKLAPKKYGEKITHAGDSDQPLEVVVRRIGPKGE